jgi:hypothetical protein
MPPAIMNRGKKIKRKKNRLYEENPKLKEKEEQRKKDDIIENISRYLILTPKYEASVLGGISNGSISIQNTLAGLTFQK